MLLMAMLHVVFGFALILRNLQASGFKGELLAVNPRGDNQLLGVHRHESVAFFKAAAKKHHTQYQKMIRQLLDEYVSQQKQR